MHQIIQGARHELIRMTQEVLLHRVGRHLTGRLHQLQHRVPHRASLGLRLPRLLHSPMVRAPCHAEHIRNYGLG